MWRWTTRPTLHAVGQPPPPPSAVPSALRPTSWTAGQTPGGPRHTRMASGSAWTWVRRTRWGAWTSAGRRPARSPTVCRVARTRTALGRTSRRSSGGARAGCAQSSREAARHATSGSWARRGQRSMASASGTSVCALSPTPTWHLADPPGRALSAVQSEQRPPRWTGGGRPGGARTTRTTSGSPWTWVPPAHWRAWRSCGRRPVHGSTCSRAPRTGQTG
mmetsp:Transcript_86090/g.256876  ORF Transcript_86090/g.256876 Transcript_86090/m.256876 type:complete len:219 (+) Transcript_86090:724-1380(+)